MITVQFRPWTVPAIATNADIPQGSLSRQLPCLLAGALGQITGVDATMQWLSADEPVGPQTSAEGADRRSNEPGSQPAPDSSPDFLVQGYATFLRKAHIHLYVTRPADGSAVLRRHYRCTLNDLAATLQEATRDLCALIQVAEPPPLLLPRTWSATCAFILARDAEMVHKIGYYYLDPEAPFQYYLDVLRQDKEFTHAEALLVNLALDFGLEDHGPAVLALAALKRLVRNRPGSARAWGALGCILARFDRWSEAIAALETCQQLDPENFKFQLVLGRAYRRAGNHDAAESVLRQAAQDCTTEKEARLELSALLAHQERREEGIIELERALALDPFDGEAYSHLGLTLHGIGRTDEAAVAFRNGLRIAPDHWGLLNGFAFHLNQLQQRQAAAEVLVQALQVARTSEQRSASAKLLADVVENALRENATIGRWARGVFDEALSYAPDSAQLLWSAANTLIDQGLTAAAERHLRHLLTLCPGLHVAHNNLGCLLAATKRYADAANCFATAHQLAPAEEAYKTNLTAAQDRAAQKKPGTTAPRGRSRPKKQG